MKQLFPDSIFKNVPRIFPNVNSEDCGSFAIAFATSVYFGRNLVNTLYDKTKLRSHLCKISNYNRLMSFPTVNNPLIQRTVCRKNKTVEYSNIIGLQNFDSVSCYANTIQSLFNNDNIVKFIKRMEDNSIIKIVFNQYVLKLEVDVKFLR